MLMPRMNPNLSQRMQLKNILENMIDEPENRHELTFFLKTSGLASPTYIKAVFAWFNNGLLVRYKDEFIKKYTEIPFCLEYVRKELVREIDLFKKGSGAREAINYLFLEWMPLGYATMLPIEELGELEKATLGIMQYGIGVTLLDDVADTDVMDCELGKGASNKITKYIHYYFRQTLTQNNSRLPKLTDKEERITSSIINYIDSYIAYLDQRRYSLFFANHFTTIIIELTKSCVICRSIRRRMKKGEASLEDLTRMARCVPHGMTVIMVGLLGYIHHTHVIKEACFVNKLIEDFNHAQLACHYQNALATIYREIAVNDPTNPIIINALKENAIDQSDYVNGKIKMSLKDPIISRYEDRIKIDLRKEIDYLEQQEPYYEERKMGEFYKTFLFGVHNLGVLYDVTAREI